MTVFKPHPMDDDQLVVSAMIVQAAADLDTIFETELFPSRETSLAKTKLEEAVMWANKSVALHGTDGGFSDSEFE